MNDEYKDTAVIVMPALWPSDYPDPSVPDLHCTLFFLGDVTDVGYTKQDVLDAIAGGLYNTFIMAKVYEVDFFGPDSDIPVVKVRHPLINQIHNGIMSELVSRGIEWSKNYDFTPHVTIDEGLALTGPIPENIWLKPVELWWRNEKIKVQ